MVLQSQPIIANPEMETGTSFWQIYQGSTASGFGQVSKIWQVSAYVGNGVYRCKAVSDNTVGKLNPDYHENFSEAEIKRIMADNPILNAAPNKCTYSNG